MILNRLGVRGKLNLLLLLPLVAVVLITIPFIAGQVGSASSAGTTANAALHAKQAGALVSELQRERLITAGYLVKSTADRVDLLLQYRRVADAADALHDSLEADAPEELLSVLVRLDTLDDIRQSALQRNASIDRVYRAYHAVIDAVIDALQLGPQRGGDAEGTRQLSALDALLRANEQAALRGIALITAAMDPQIGLNLLDESSAQSQMLTERFVQQADVDQAGLLVQVEQGETARRVDSLVNQVRRLPPVRAADTLTAFVGDALASVESQAGLRRLVQDRVTSAITQAAAGRATAAQSTAWTVGLGATFMLIVVMALSVVVSRSIAEPLRRLTVAATAVADLANAELVRVNDAEDVDEQPPQLGAITVSSSGEVGELAAAFNRVQTTAAMLLERQIVTRRNVSLMFANVAQRTQNLVNRQLALVDELERNEQNAQLLASLYRLDHLSARLRRSTENLLVVAGVRDETRLAGPTVLVTVLRSALSEIEDYQRVRISETCEGTVAAPLVSDLVVVFAELIENAAVFSPPESLVEVTALPRPDGGCEVNIIDHGIGMLPQRLAEENGRLVARERLDITPTTVLGLFVVGRLARRHSIGVELLPTPEGGITARVAIPPSLFSLDAAAATSQPRELSRDMAATRQRQRQMIPQSVLIPAAGPHEEGFDWFSAKPDDPAGHDNGRTAHDNGRATHDNGRATHDNGRAAHDNGGPAPAEPAKPVESPAPPARAETANQANQARQSGHEAGTMPRGVFSRRVPGAQVPDAHLPVNAKPVGDKPTGAHDPAAVRAAMDDFQSAIARAAMVPMTPPPPPSAGAAPPPSAGAAPPPSAGSTPPSAGSTPPSAGPTPTYRGRVTLDPRDPGPSRGRAPVTSSPIGSVPLVRRSPGSHLAPSLRSQPTGTPPTPPEATATQPARDPEAERAAFDAYTSGIARALAQTDHGVRQPDQ